MKAEKVGVMRMTADGLRDLATAMDNIYTKKNTIVAMGVWKGHDGLYMQVGEESGFINLCKDKQELKKYD